MDLYLFTREGCVNCPAAKRVVEEIGETVDDLHVIAVNADDIGDDLQDELLENQLFIFSTPAVVIRNDNGLKMFSSGDVPDPVALIVALGG